IRLGLHRRGGELATSEKRLIGSTARPSTPWAARRADGGYGVTADPDWRGVDWQALLRGAEIGGRRVSYVDVGPKDAPAVVLVHGLGGQWQNWLENIPRLARRRRVIALDLPGFGCSEMPAGRISISSYAGCVEALLDRLELGSVAVVGNSMGGFIASEVAIQFPRRVERLVLVSAAGITGPNVLGAPARTVGRLAAITAAYTAARHRAMAKRPITRHLALALVARHPGRLKADLAYEGLMRGVGRPAFDDALRACLDYDFRDRLGEISCPTLIVWGENDSILPVRDAREFERLIPRSRSVVMRDTGHIPQVERPGAFNELLEEFLDE
ncbi:MAG TPA: alpha/beta fold hydrolase, partial [Thermoleophilaceae bacterium]|nr:alpha/beta fold hydrolase [Thermoleophilaceae bacterium]